MSELSFNKGSIWLNVNDVTNNAHNIASLIKVRIYAELASAGPA